MQNHSSQTTKNIEVARRVAQEGMVLLENNGVLPLKKGTPIAVFGIGQIDYVKVGTGSGAVHSEYSINLITGLRNNGKIRFDEDLSSIYETYYKSCKNNKSNPKTHDILATHISTPEMPLTEAIVTKAAENSRIAIVTFNRSSGEDSDHTLTKGDYYLTEAEEDMFSKVRSYFDKVIAVLNIGSVMDMNWVETYKVDAVLMAWLAGMEGGNAMADILSGDVNPSGKLTDTFAKNYMDYPSSYNFGGFVEGYETVLSNGSEIEYWGITSNHNAHPRGTSYKRPINNRYFVNYEEGIYVGYRYFETFNVPVKYPFGYGLSYTTFEISTSPIIVKDNKIGITAKVKNTGHVLGKEVVQIYYSAPDGKLEKPTKSLVAYGKTDLIRPGKSCTLTISYDISHMASYDEGTASYILEAGNYDIFVGNSVKNVKKAGTYKIESTVTTQQLTNQVGLSAGIKLKTLSKFDPTGTFPTTPQMHVEPICAEYNPLLSANNTIETKAIEKSKIRLKDVYDGKAIMSDFLAQMTEMELIDLLVGVGYDSAKSIFGALFSAVPDKPGYIAAINRLGIPTIVLTDGPAGIRSLAMGGSGYTATLNHLGIPTIVLADGPAGPRLGIPIISPDDGSIRMDKGKPCTAFPTETLVACTWNEYLVEEMGTTIGREVIASGIDFWLAPGLNIHRNPLCGRNFEYYSEDPLISGTMAAAAVRGVQSCGVGATCKHFAANNQETNRSDGVDAVVTERTLREIYLKGFEIAVKSAAPWAIMTSYNSINGAYTAARRDLNVDVLRKEWGFDGIVMTDWEGDGVYSVEALKAEHNLLMPGFVKQMQYIYNKIQDGTLLRSELERCAADLLKVIMKTKSFAKYYELTDNSNGLYSPPERWFTIEK